MEKLEDLNLEGLKIYQNDNLYCFTSDAILLSRFPTVKKGEVVADFCSGSGIVGLHLFGLNKDKVKSVHLFEMQSDLYELSKKSIEINDLSDKFFAVNCKVQDIDSTFNEKFSLIVCNPPYMEKGAGEVNEKRHIAVCRAELELTLKELVRAISKSLKFGGRTCLVHRADRLCEVISEMQKNNIEPKRLQFVNAGKKEPYLFLIEGVKGGKSGLKVLNAIKN